MGTMKSNKLKGIAVAAVLAASVTVGGTAAFAQVAQAQSGAPRVLVTPFTTLNAPTNQQWIGKAVQDVLVADLARTNSYSAVTAAADAQVPDNATAVRLGQQANAPYVITGSAQVVEQNVRLTATLINTQNGAVTASASVTGPMTELLRLEDGLSGQLRNNAVTAAGGGQVLPPPPAAVTPTYPTYSVTPPSQQAVQPVAAVAPSDPTAYQAVNMSSGYTPGYTTYPSYNYGYSSPYYSTPYYGYGYSYPYVGIGFGFGGYYGGGWGGRGGRGGWGGGGWHGGGWNGGGGGWHGGGGFSGGGIHGGGGFGGGGHR